jgi:hypothetical protein
MELSQDQHDLIVKALDTGKKCIEELTAERDALLLRVDELKKEEQDTRNQYTALKHSAGDRVAELEGKFEEAREIIAQVSYSPEFWKWFHGAVEQDPCGVHAFTAKYAEKPKCDQMREDNTPCRMPLPCPRHTVGVLNTGTEIVGDRP